MSGKDLYLHEVSGPDAYCPEETSPDLYIREGTGPRTYSLVETVGILFHEACINELSNPDAYCDEEALYITAREPFSTPFRKPIRVPTVT